MKLIIVFHNTMMADVAFLGIVLPIYLSKLGFNPLSIGTLLTVSTFSNTSRAIVFAILSDRYGRKRLLMLERTFSLFYFTALILSDNFLLLCLASFIGSSSQETLITDALMADKSSAGERTKIFSLRFFTGSLFSTLGTLLSGLPPFLQASAGLSEVNSFKILFGIGLLTVLLSIGLLNLVTDTKPSSSSSRPFLPKRSLKIIGKFSVTNAIDNMAVGITMSLFSLWLNLRFDIGLEVVGLVFTFSQIFETFAYLAAPLIASKFGTVNGIVLIRAVGAALIALLAVAPTPLLAALIYAARNFFQRMSHPLRQSFMMGILNPEERASVASFASLPRVATGSLAPMVGGYLIEISYVLPPITSAAIFALGDVVYYLFFRNVRPPEERLP